MRKRNLPWMSIAGLPVSKQGLTWGARQMSFGPSQTWVAFFRHRFVRRLKGDDFYEQLGDDCFGALRWGPGVEQGLVEQVVERIREGAENLDVFWWAIRERLPAPLAPAMQSA